MRLEREAGRPLRPPGLFLMLERVGELGEEPKARLAPLVLERVDGGREARDDLELARRRAEEALGLAGLEQEVDRDRGLVREEAEELHLLQAEERLLRAVEHREDAERALLVEERRGHEPFGT